MAHIHALRKIRRCATPRMRRLQALVGRHRVWGFGGFEGYRASGPRVSGFLGFGDLGIWGFQGLGFNQGSRAGVHRGLGFRF